MKELMEYREKLIERIDAAAKAFRAACAAATDPLAPVEVGGWSVHQLAAHTRDVDKHVYGMRVRRTAAEEEPLFPNFDADEWMAGHYDASEPLPDILDDFVDSVTSLVEQLEELPTEAWSRESRHETLGSGFTLQSWVERGLAHVEEHLATVSKAK